MNAPDIASSNSKSTAPHRIYAVIKERIIDGTYHPGQRLTEQSFADEFEASRTPVREAIRLLASEGYVVFRPNSGTVVRSWSVAELLEIFRLRARLEADICGNAALHINAEQIDRLCVLQDAIELEGTDNSEANTTRVSRLNREFHDLIAVASQQERMAAVLAKAIEVPVVHRTFRSYSPQQMQRSFSQHRELIDAFKAHDHDWAVAIMRCHIHAAKNAILHPKAPAIAGSLP
ncbi:MULTISPECIES: GntR family transcriptional regulator [unclassified Simplicispira]|uniref:GntR family transcriptional regulator n=1 Tax=unclassified Simplicispira TaxID=2630407 RepID=UPI000D5DF84F|nr:MULTISPECIES: GntR family transcriptional regulator [unclassified Simplicispira]PVY56153.1 DNA-binding GntR family transcriptional regulator [Simplicispira sp. 125]REG17098.1 DNA-binding GntR family transcriptional regulator [Simplicispira sp. 110]